MENIIVLLVYYSGNHFFVWCYTCNDIAPELFFLINDKMQNNFV